MSTETPQPTPDERPESPPKDQPASGGRPASASAGRLLLASAEPAVRHEATRWLASAGFDVVVAEGAGDVIARFDAQPPAVVLVDQALRDEGGQHAQSGASRTPGRP